MDLMSVIRDVGCSHRNNISIFMRTSRYTLIFQRKKKNVSLNFYPHLNTAFFSRYLVARITYRVYTKEWCRFQKLTRNLFLTLHGNNVHRQQRRLSKFLMRYQQLASHAYYGASFQDGVAAGKGSLCAPF